MCYIYQRITKLIEMKKIYVILIIAVLSSCGIDLPVNNLEMQLYEAKVDHQIRMMQLEELEKAYQIKGHIENKIYLAKMDSIINSWN